MQSHPFVYILSIAASKLQQQSSYNRDPMAVNAEIIIYYLDMHRKSLLTNGLQS